MAAGRVRLDGNREVALAGVSRLEAQSTLTADGEEGDVCSRLVGRRAGWTGNLRGSTAACVQHVKKFPRIGDQLFDGVDPTGSEGRVGDRGQLSEIVINLESGDLIVLRAGNIEIADCMIRTAGGYSQSRCKGYCQGQTHPAEFPELHAFPSSRSLSRSRAALAAKLYKKWILSLIVKARVTFGYSGSPLMRCASPYAAGVLWIHGCTL